MGKKYLETKNKSLESSILGVWKTAVEEGAGRMDGRTAEYRNHRKQLEAARQRRESKKVTKEEVELDEIAPLAVGAARVGAAGAKVAGKVAKVGAKVVKKGAQAAAVGIKKGGDKLKKKIHKATADEFNLDENGTHVNPKDRDELDKEADAKAGSETAKKIKRAQEPTPNQMTEAQSGDKEAYKKFFNSALKKFNVSSPADLKGDDKKKFYDYVDKNWEGDNEKAEGAMSQVREFKAQHMKAALAKVWGLDEHKGTEPHKHPHEEDEVTEADAVKKYSYDDATADMKRKDKMAALKKTRDHEYRMKHGKKEEIVKNGKTETGKKAAVIDLKPKIKD